MHCLDISIIKCTPDIYQELLNLKYKIIPCEVLNYYFISINNDDGCYDDYYDGYDDYYDEKTNINFNNDDFNNLGIEFILNISTDYFGGCGEQSSQLIDLKNNKILNFKTINDGLKKIGIIKTNNIDEFDTIGIDRYRSYNDIIEKYNSIHNISEDNTIDDNVIIPIIGIGEIKKDELSEIQGFLQLIEDYGHIYNFPSERLTNAFNKILEGIKEVEKLIDENYGR